MPPLELVALVDENADLLPDGPDGRSAGGTAGRSYCWRWICRARAGPVLEKLMKAAPTEAGRAGFGARLAAMRQREGDAAGALAALAASDAPRLSRRIWSSGAALLLAAVAGAPGRYRSRRWRHWHALKTAAADEARATHPGARERLAGGGAGADRLRRDKTVPPQRASWTTRSGGPCCGWRPRRPAQATTRHWRDCGSSEATRMGTGPLADMFRLLTPIRCGRR